MDSLEFVFLQVEEQQTIARTQPEESIVLFFHQVGSVEKPLPHLLGILDIVMESHAIEDIERVLAREP